MYGLTLYSTFLAQVDLSPVYLLISGVIFAAVCFLAVSTWALFGAAIRVKLQNDAYRKKINAFLALLLVYTAVELSGVLAWFGNG